MTEAVKDGITVNLVYDGRAAKVMLNQDIIFCAEKIQCDSALRGLKEDKINKKIKDLLEAKGYLTLDQTQQGKSLKGKELIQYCIIY